MTRWRIRHRFYIRIPVARKKLLSSKIWRGGWIQRTPSRMTLFIPDIIQSREFLFASSTTHEVEWRTFVPEQTYPTDSLHSRVASDDASNREERSRDRYKTTHVKSRRQIEKRTSTRSHRSWSSSRKNFEWCKDASGSRTLRSAVSEARDLLGTRNLRRDKDQQVFFVSRHVCRPSVLSL